MAKNKRNIYKKIILTFVAILLVTLIIYALYQIIQLAVKPTDVFVVNNGEIYSEENAEGYIIRDESIVEKDTDKDIIQIKTEGEKVAKGEIIYRYNIENEEDMNIKIQELTSQIQEALEGQTNLFSSDIKAIETQIDNKIVESRKKNNLQNIKEYKNDISTYITKKAKIAGSLSSSETYINSLIEEKEAIENKLNECAEYIYSPASGVISYRIDGFENEFKADDFSYVTSEFLSNKKLKTGQVTNTSSEQAKIVNNYKCYIATVLSSENALNVKENKTLKIRLPNGDIIKGQIVYKNIEANNKIVLVIEINDDVTDLMEYRKISFDIIWWEVEGLKIPKKAIYYENSLAYVTRNKSGYIDKILVKILEESDDYCIVENYDTNELKELGFSSEEIMSNKKIYLYDELMLNP